MCLPFYFSVARNVFFCAEAVWAAGWWWLCLASLWCHSVGAKGGGRGEEENHVSYLLGDHD